MPVLKIRKRTKTFNKEWFFGTAAATRICIQFPIVNHHHEENAIFFLQISHIMEQHKKKKSMMSGGENYESLKLERETNWERKGRKRGRRISIMWKFSSTGSKIFEWKFFLNHHRNWKWRPFYLFANVFVSRHDTHTHNSHLLLFPTRSLAHISFLGSAFWCVNFNEFSEPKSALDRNAA